MKEHKKVAFIITIVLLAIFLPFTVLSIIFHKKYVDGNPNHDFHYNNKLWFYDESGNLVGTYDCNSESCGYAQETIRDPLYGINYFKAATTEPVAFINNRFAVISDSQNASTDIFVYDVVNGTKTDTFLGYKMYFVGIQDDYLITINNEGKYGVVKLGDVIKPVIEYQYDFIALQNERANGSKKIKSDKFIAQMDGVWKLIDTSNNTVTSSFSSPIVSYDDRNIVVKSTEAETDEYYSGEEEYRLYSYDGAQLLPGGNRLLRITDGYIEVVDENNLYYIISANTYERVSNSFYFDNISTLFIDVKDTTIDVYTDGKVAQTIDIQ